MIRTLMLISAGLLSATSYSQTKKFDFKLGQEYDLPLRSDELAYTGNPKDGIVNICVRKDELTVMRFDPTTLSKTFEEKIHLDATKRFASEILTSFSNSSYYWIHSDWDKVTGTESVSFDKVDVQKGTLSNENELMFTTTRVVGDISGKYNYLYDLEKNLIAVNYRLFPESRNDKKNFDKLGFQVFDNKMKKIWGAEFAMPYSEAMMDLSYYTLDAKGNCYLLAKVYNSDRRNESDKSSGLPAYRYEIMKFAKGDKMISIIPVKMDDRFVRDARIAETINGQILFSCTYSKKG